MKKFTLDTNIISYLLKGNKIIAAKIKEKLDNGDQIIINPITYYEICRGLLAVNNTKKLEKFKEICKIFRVNQITEKTLYKAAEIYAYLRKKGKLIDDADIFIAAICIEEDIILITNNEKHFLRIKELELEKWPED